MTALPKAAWIVAAIAVAATAVFAVLSISSSGTASHDPYTNHANRLCRTAARKIAETKRRYERIARRASLGSFAESLAHIIGDVKAKIGSLAAPPSDRIEPIVTMERAMLESEVRLIQVAQGSGRILTRTRRADAASDRVKDAASSAGLAQCGRLSLGVPSVTG